MGLTSQKQGGGTSAVDEGFASVLEAGEFLRLSRAKVYGLMDAGELMYAKFGKARRIPCARGNPHR